MSISDKLEDAKSSMHEILRDRKFKKENMARQEAADLQYKLMVCRGKIEACKKELSAAVRTQSKAVREGREQGYDVQIQENMLWDAAIGYMMVKDAIYALATISTYDSISHAYEMLDAAVKMMVHKKGKIKEFSIIGKQRTRNGYNYITSQAAQKEKEALLDGFYEDLVLSGDIEACIQHAGQPAVVDAQRRGAYTGSGRITSPRSGGSSDLDRCGDILSTLPDDTSGEDFSQEELDSMMDLTPPEIGK